MQILVSSNPSRSKSFILLFIKYANIIFFKDKKQIRRDSSTLFPA